MEWIYLTICAVLSAITLAFVIGCFMEEEYGAGVVVLIVGLLMNALWWVPAIYSVNYASVENTRTCVVTDVAKVNEFEQSTNGSRVYCEDGSNYVISDNFTRGLFESSNVYNKVKAARGKEITVKTIGFRNGFFSSFENIIEVQEVKDK